MPRLSCSQLSVFRRTSPYSSTRMSYMDGPKSEIILAACLMNDRRIWRPYRRWQHFPQRRKKEESKPASLCISYSSSWLWLISMTKVCHFVQWQPIKATDSGNSSRPPPSGAVPSIITIRRDRKLIIFLRDDDFGPAVGCLDDDYHRHVGRSISEYELNETATRCMPGPVLACPGR